MKDNFNHIPINLEDTTEINVDDLVEQIDTCESYRLFQIHSNLENSFILIQIKK